MDRNLLYICLEEHLYEHQLFQDFLGSHSSSSALASSMPGGYHIFAQVRQRPSLTLNSLNSFAKSWRAKKFICMMAYEARVKKTTRGAVEQHFCSILETFPVKEYDTCSSNGLKEFLPMFLLMNESTNILTTSTLMRINVHSLINQW